MKDAPKRKTEQFSIEDPTERAVCLATARLLSEAFDWEDHPWGEEFWDEVHEELLRLWNDGKEP